MNEVDLAVSFKNAFIYQADKNLVLSSVSFDIAKGEFVYLIGRTGSGKSSLLKTLYADLWLEKGNANIAGFDLHTLKRKDIPFLRRKLGVVFQDFQLFTDRSVKDNLQFVLEATGWKNKALIKRRIDEVLTEVGLENSLEKFPHQLSGGEQQRLVIARSLLNNPIILLADEPTGNLDPEVSEQIMATFEAINAKGTAVLMATHDFELIRKYPRRILKCENGMIHENETSGNTLKANNNTFKPAFQYNKIQEPEVYLLIETNENAIIGKQIDIENATETCIPELDQTAVKSIVEVEKTFPNNVIENELEEIKSKDINLEVQTFELDNIVENYDNTQDLEEQIFEENDIELNNNNPQNIEINSIEIEKQKFIEVAITDELNLAPAIAPELVKLAGEHEIIVNDQIEIEEPTKDGDLIESTLTQNNVNVSLENLITIKPVKAKFKKENAKLNTSFFDSFS